MQIEKAYYWPAWLINSYDHKNKHREQKRFFGKVQIYLWRALNIYDDFLDNEGKPKDLPLANRYFRNFLKIIYNIKLPKYFYDWADQKFFILEEANRQELAAKKIKIKDGLITIPSDLPEFKNLAKLSEKSLTLAIIPAAFLIKLGFIKTTKELKVLNNFFKYALAAKQLSDDASDWLEDLNNGFITAVNVLILKEAKKRKIKLNYQEEPEILYLLFIEAAAEYTSLNILNLCLKTRREANRLGLNNQAEIIIKLIKPLEMAAQKALDFKKML